MFIYNNKKKGDFILKKTVFTVMLVLVLVLGFTGCELNQKTVSLTVSTEGNGTVVAYPNVGEVLAGGTVLLIPQADDGWIFDAWIHNGSILSTFEELSLTVDEDFSVIAQFIQESSTIPTIGYRLEAEWGSYKKTDRLLNVSLQSSEAKGMGIRTNDGTALHFQIANYLPDEADSVPREKAILIKYAQDSTPTYSTLSETLAKFGPVELNQYSAGIPFVRMVVDKEDYDSIPALLEQLRASEGVEFAEEDELYKIHSIPNDPLFSYQWNLTALDMPAVWDVTFGNESVVVAVLDTGVYFPLDDLNRTRFAQGFDFVNNSVNPFDDNGHGSHVTGTIAQSTNNGRGVAGMASNVKILPVKVLGSDGYGFVSGVAEGIIFAVNNGADIINMSLGGPYSDLIDDACEYASDHGVLVIASTGNDGISSISYPSALSGVVSVGAVNDLGNKTSYSNYGTGLDVMAPGGDFSRTLYNDEFAESFPGGILQESIDPVYGEAYMYYSGTSMAAPHVAGLAALIKSKNQSLSALQIEEIITSTADDDAYTSGYDTLYGFGLINPVRALGITPYAMSDSINSEIAMVPGITHRWRISAAESRIQARLNYLDNDTQLILRLEKPDGTILKVASGSGDYFHLDYNVDDQIEGYLWLTVSVGL